MSKVLVQNILDKKTLAYKVKISNRKLKIATEKQSCKEIIGKIKKDESIYAFTGGQFGISSILQTILDVTDVASVKIITWSVGDVDLHCLYDFLKEKRISDIKFLIDYSFPTRLPRYFEKMIKLFPKVVKGTNSHAKLMIINNKNWNIVVRTSMNLNKNTRFENFEIIEGKQFTDFHLNIFNSIWKESKFLDDKLKASEYKNISRIKFKDELETNDLDFDFDFNFDIE